MARRVRQPEYEFVLALTATEALSQEAEDALFEAGCDDATISLRNGRVYLSFCRAAASLKDAIVSAIQNVRAAKIDAHVLRVDDDNLVTLSDIARRIGRTRQCIHQYMLGSRGPGDFPPPISEVCEGTLLWKWREVAFWLYQNDMLQESELRDADQ
jgi:MoaA/NifB/PqqE/SkfB family radical SAM enzyme